MMNQTVTQKEGVHQAMTSSELLEQWQSHRRLTRKVIEAFPDDKFFEFSIGGMRPFSEMVTELLAIAVPGIREIATGEPSELKEHVDHGNSKEKMLQFWDEATDKINMYWSQLNDERFHEIIKAFGMYEGTVLSSILYFIDNEIHHRGQGYVYLRALEIEPPAFWER